MFATLKCLFAFLQFESTKASIFSYSSENGLHQSGQLNAWQFVLQRLEYFTNDTQGRTSIQSTFPIIRE